MQKMESMDDSITKIVVTHNKKIMALYQKVESITTECEICKGLEMYTENGHQQTCPCRKVEDELKKIMMS